MADSSIAHTRTTSNLRALVRRHTALSGRKRGLTWDPLNVIREGRKLPPVARARQGFVKLCEINPDTTLTENITCDY
jgi:hypothetical protein